MFHTRKSQKLQTPTFRPQPERHCEGESSKFFFKNKPVHRSSMGVSPVQCLFGFPADTPNNLKMRQRSKNYARKEVKKR